MRETFYTLIFLLCLSINCQAMSPAMLGGAGGGAAACTQTKLHSQETTTTSQQIGQATTNQYRASSYTAGTNDAIKTLYVLLDKDGADSATVVTAYLCPDNVGTPGTPPNISTCTAADATVAHSALSADAADVKFNWAAGYAQTASATYWIVVKFAYIDGSSFINWSNNGSVVGQTIYRDTDGVPNWTQVDSSGQHNYKAYNCVE